jgi:hypothetical protein
MPSSPLGPHFSPPAREFVEFGKEQRTRTLEWACARRRLAGKDERGGGLPGLISDDEDATDVESDEAVTPPSTWGESDSRWTATTDGKAALKPEDAVLIPGEPDDDTMKAALALCGLMRG